MKKILVTALAVVMMTVGLVGTASATLIPYTYTNEAVNSWAWQGRTVTWNMEMPGDFEIPFDTLKRAELSIYSQYVDPRTYALVSQVNTVVGYLSKNESTTVSALEWKYEPNNQEGVSNLTGFFNVAPFISDSWLTGDPLAVSLSLNNYESAGLAPRWYFIDKAVLKIDYENVDPPMQLRIDNENTGAPVPEPGTMALLGFGLLGLVVYGKRRMNRDA